MTNRVMALDIASATGACWTGPDNRPQFATYRLPAMYSSQDIGPRCKAFVNWLHPLVTQIRPAIIGIEAPLPPRQVVNTFATARLLITLSGMAHWVAAERNIRVIEKHVASVKQYFASTTRGGKDPVMARCRQLGWAIKNDNEADAGALWALICAENDPKWNIEPTPLFASAAEMERLANAAREQ